MTATMASSARLIAHWNPEDGAFWRRAGQRVARRNLALSALALMLAFAVWMLWSVVVVYLPAAGFRFSTNQLFWLVALPALSGATLRVFYAFAVPVFGGRRWTALSTASLLVPALGMGFALQDPGTPYEALIVLALLCGLGGGNFASSMAHIGPFYPRGRVGWALGLNAGLGNLGVSLVQALVPLVVASSLFGTSPTSTAGPAPLWLANAGFVWVPLIAASSLAAWFGMNDLAAVRASFGEQAVVFRRRQTWISCWLYLGTFGSFIGLSAAFPLVLSTHFPGADATHLAWLGPLLGAALRPLGGWLADRFGGARITLACLITMLLGTLALMTALPAAGGEPSAARLLTVGASFMALFAAAGVGSSSVFRMVSLLFARLHGVADEGREGADDSTAARHAHTEAGAALGFCGAIGAYGGFVIPKSFGTAIAFSGSAAPALTLFAVFYLSCIALAWWHHARPGAPLPC